MIFTVTFSLIKIFNQISFPLLSLKLSITSNLKLDFISFATPLAFILVPPKNQGSWTNRPLAKSALSKSAP